MYYPREAQRDHLYNRIVMLTIACIVLLAIAVMARADGIRYAALLVNPVVTTGTVTQIEVPAGNTRAATISYEYGDNSGGKRAGEYFDPSYSAGTQYQEGKPIQIHYCGWFPSISSTAEQVPTLLPGFYIMTGAVVLALLLFGISFLTLGQIGRMKAEDAYY